MADEAAIAVAIRSILALGFLHCSRAEWEKSCEGTRIELDGDQNIYFCKPGTFGNKEKDVSELVANDIAYLGSRIDQLCLVSGRLEGRIARLETPAHKMPSDSRLKSFFASWGYRDAAPAMFDQLRKIFRGEE